MGQIVENHREGLVEASEVVSKPIQVDPREVESWARNPETALQHLATLLDALMQKDEDLLSWVTEALENCGVPRPKPYLHANGAASLNFFRCDLLGCDPSRTDG